MGEVKELRSKAVRVDVLEVQLRPRVERVRMNKPARLKDRQLGPLCLTDFVARGKA